MKKVMLGAFVCALAFSANAEDVIVEGTAKTNPFSSVYAGLGIGGNFQKDGINKFFDRAEKDVNKGKNRFLGSFVIGAGKQFNNNVYVAGEFMGDFAKKIRHEEKNDSKTYMGGFIPHVNAKVGYVFKHDVLAYGKLGLSWRKVGHEDYNDSSNNDSKKKSSVVLGLGVEKAFCKKFSAALEADYDFGYGWKPKFDSDYKYDIGSGWNVRALVKYNVKY